MTVTVNWSRYPTGGIQLDAAGEVWGSGRVRAVLPISPTTILVASETGGLWTAHENGTAVLLSDLAPVDLACLGQARTAKPGQFQYFAGGAALWATDPAASLPLLSWELVGTAGVGGINQIIVDEDVRRIVLATDSGLMWTTLPATWNVNAQLVWNWAVDPSGARIAGRFYGVALARAKPGIQRTIVATRVLRQNGASMVAPEKLLLFGGWDTIGATDSLVLNERTFTAPVTPPFIPLAEASVAASAAMPYVVYVAIAKSSGDFGYLLRSDDGGDTWTGIDPKLSNPTTQHPDFRTAAGNQGSASVPNNCISVSEADPNAKTLAIGWREQGLFVSTDSGVTFRATDHTAHFHCDVRGVAFDSFDPRGRRIYAGTDGGVTRMDGLGSDIGTFTSMFNRGLGTIQFYTFGGQIGGDVIGGGTQDTAMLYASTATNGPTWRALLNHDIGDGKLLIGAGSDGVIYNYNTGPDSRLAWWDTTSQSFQWIEKVIPLDDVVSQSVYGTYLLFTPGEIKAKQKEPLKNGIFVAVRNPSGRPPADGYFPITVLGTNDALVWSFRCDPNGDSPIWDFLFGPVILELAQPQRAQPNITAMDSADGSVIYLGYERGHVVQWSYARDGLNRAREYAIPSAVYPNGWSSANSAFTHIAAVDDKLAFAVLRMDNPGSPSQWALLRLDGESQITSLQIWPAEIQAIEAVKDASDLAVFLAFDNIILVSQDGGRIWTPAVSGLPNHAKSRALRYLRQRSGEAFLYLGTFGHAAWRTKVQFRT